jgi:hypothetical protein
VSAAVALVDRGTRNPAARWPLWSFIAVALLLELAVVAARPGADLMPFALVLVPALAATIVAGAGGGRSAVRGLFVRISRWRVPRRWYALAIGIPLLGTLAIDVLGIVAGQATISALIGALTPAVLIVPLVVFLPAVFEEYGWRGFGVESGVDRGISPAWTAMVVGAIFFAMHLPLYLSGQMYDGLSFWPAPLTLFGYSALFTWLYLGSGRSALITAIAHATANGLTPLTSGLGSDWVWATRGIVFGLIGLACLVALSRAGQAPADQLAS